MENTLVERKITYTYTAPNGAVVVVTGVPALCDDQSDNEFCGFSEEVSERISELVYAALASNPQPGEVRTVKFTDDPTAIKPDVDLEVKVSGPGLVLGRVQVPLLQKILDNINDAFRRAASALANKTDASLPPPPQVAFFAPGSLVIGLRSGDSEPLFREYDLGKQALELIVRGAEWAGEGTVPDEDPIVVVAAIEAAKQLMPGPREGFKVQLIEYADRKPIKSTELSPELRERASEIIEDISTKNLHKQLVHFVGLLDEIKLDKKAHLRQLSKKPEGYRGETLRFSYSEELLDELLELFGKIVKVTAEEERAPDGERYTVIDVEIATD